VDSRLVTEVTAQSFGQSHNGMVDIGSARDVSDEALRARFRVSHHHSHGRTFVVFKTPGRSPRDL